MDHPSRDQKQDLKQRLLNSRSHSSQSSLRRRRNTYDRSPMRRLNNYSSPDRQLHYSCDPYPINRRASSEMLYSSSRSNYPPIVDRNDDYPHRRWSDDYTYARPQLQSSHIERTGSFGSSRKYIGERWSPRQQQQVGYNNYSNKPIQNSSYNQKYSSLPDKQGSRDYGYDNYGDSVPSNYDCYNNGYGKQDRMRSDYQDSSDKIPRRDDNPNIRRYLLARDPKDKRISGNGLGMKVVGGKEIPGTNGRLGAYIAKITPGGVVATLGELKEGYLVVEWNGRNLLDKTYEEVQKVISQTSEEMEVEVGVRTDIDMLNDKVSSNAYYPSDKNSGNMSHSEGSRSRNDSHNYSSSRREFERSRNDSFHSNREYGSKRPPFDPLDINGNETSMQRSQSFSRMEDDYRYRDSQRQRNPSYSSSKYYPEDAKENCPTNYDRMEGDYYNRSRSPPRRGYRSKEEDYYYDRNERSSRRRRSFELKDNRYYSSRDRDMSPDSRYDSSYRETRSYSPERSRPRDRLAGRGQYDNEPLGDHQIGSTNQTQSRQLHSTPSSLNLTTVESPKRRMLPKTSNNQRGLSSDQQSYYSDEKNSNPGSGSKTHRADKSDLKNPSTGSQRSSRDHKRHSKSGNGRISKSSRGKLVSQGSGSKQDQSSLGQVELQICYDMIANILYVTVLRAKGLLTLRDDGETCPDPFVKVYLLPGRSIENQRRTRHFTRTSDPEWNQTMVYPNLQASDLKKRYLEVTAWNFDRNKPNEFLGEVVLDLSDPAVVDEEPKWYQLQEMVETENNQQS